MNKKMEAAMNAIVLEVVKEDAYDATVAIVRKAYLAGYVDGGEYVVSEMRDGLGIAGVDVAAAKKAK